jgi:hypothetical protein
VGSCSNSDQLTHARQWYYPWKWSLCPLVAYSSAQTTLAASTPESKALRDKTSQLEIPIEVGSAPGSALSKRWLWPTISSPRAAPHEPTLPHQRFP